MASRPRGRNTIEQRIALVGSDEMLAQLKALGAAGERAAAQLKKAFDQQDAGRAWEAAVTQLRGRIDGLRVAGTNFSNAFSRLTAAGAKLETSVLHIGSQVGKITAAVSAIGGSLVLIGKSAVDAVDAADREAQA